MTLFNRSALLYIPIYPLCWVSANDFASSNASFYTLYCLCLSGERGQYKKVTMPLCKLYNNMYYDQVVIPPAPCPLPFFS